MGAYLMYARLSLTRRRRLPISRVRKHAYMPAIVSSSPMLRSRSCGTAQQRYAMDQEAHGGAIDDEWYDT